MPKEVIVPSINRRGPEPDGGQYVPLPEVHVGWMKDLGSVQVGLETPTRMIGGDHSSGQHHILDHLYGQMLEEIGVRLEENLGRVGRIITDEESDPNKPDHQVLLTSEDIGRMVLDAVTGATPDGYPGRDAHTGWYTHLEDRTAVNALIRVLRRARDAAFGKDE